jgi:hypothetical protein
MAHDIAGGGLFLADGWALLIQLVIVIHHFCRRASCPLWKRRWLLHSWCGGQTAACAVEESACSRNLHPVNEPAVRQCKTAPVCLMTVCFLLKHLHQGGAGLGRSLYVSERSLWPGSCDVKHQCFVIFASTSALPTKSILFLSNLGVESSRRNESAEYPKDGAFVVALIKRLRGRLRSSFPFETKALEGNAIRASDHMPCPDISKQVLLVGDIFGVIPFVDGQVCSPALPLGRVRG